MFHTVRKLRNNVVHNWGHKDISREELKRRFLETKENLDISGNDNDFYNRAAYVFVRIYAKASYIKNQLSLFNEKIIIANERKERGYP